MSKLRDSKSSEGQYSELSESSSLQAWAELFLFSKYPLNLCPHVGVRLVLEEFVEPSPDSLTFFDPTFLSVLFSTFRNDSISEHYKNLHSVITGCGRNNHSPLHLLKHRDGGICKVSTVVFLRLVMQDEGKAQKN